MLDGRMRSLLSPALDAGARGLDRAGLGAGAVTGIGLAVGLGACVAAGFELWAAALGLWLANRALDGLDGALARLRGPSDLGGMLDFLADFVVYAGFPLAVAIATADARVAACALLGSYLLNNVALLSFSSLIERRRLALGDERSLRFTPGLAEGTETIACYALVCLIPNHAATVFWAFTAIVMLTVAQRVALAVRTL
ncbi:MAG: CDP-alcohol phosphatidyltransferase family protein [Thermoleophilaceae bacterium]